MCVNMVCHVYITFHRQVYRPGVLSFFTRLLSSRIYRAPYIRAYLHEANFASGNLSGAVFRGCNLSGMQTMSISDFIEK